MISKLERRRRKGARRHQMTMPQEVPAPYGGLNTRDALNAMPPTDAVKLDNWFPSEGKVSVRSGYTETHDTGENGSDIEFMMEFRAGAYQQLIVGVNNRLHEASYTSEGTADGDTLNHLIDSTADFVTDGVTTDSIAINTTDSTYANVTGVLAADLTLDADNFPDGDENYKITTPIGTSYSSNRWMAVNFNGVMPLVNGADAPQQWDGSAISAPSWTGIADASTLSGVAVHKFRLYFWTGIDQSFWYAAPNAVSGTLTEFDLSRVTGLGGNLINIKSWTIDSGSGPDDFICLIFSSGEVVVYQGDDPGTAASWSIVGVYSLPEPLGGKRCCVKLGGDLKVITNSDIVSMTQTVQLGYEKMPRTKITGALSQAATIHGSSFGWEVTVGPKGKTLTINQPDYNQTYNQLVMNTVTGAWCRYTGIATKAWNRFNGVAVFGGLDGKVYQMSGNTDATAGITADALQAWSALNMPFDKLAQQARPVITAQGSISYGLALGFDFEDVEAPTPEAAASSGSSWDSSPWDTSPWSTEGLVFKSWRSVSGQGQYLSASLTVNAKQEISWLKTDYRVTPIKNT